ncbi:Tail-collar fiber protein [Pseudomonas sp. IT-P74]|uniref:phage tail protein n=1 Tax=Pseudomonas sp. IT-P74 TaxID=3026445 RepID=UPI0039DFC0C2
MIDANSQFFATLTNVGMAKQANADALGVAWTFAQMGVGDANNTDPIPSAAQTSLINERRRRPLNQVRVDPNNAAVIIAEQIIPADEGGWWIREIGLYDADGDLVAVANCAPSFKPVLSQGSGRTQVVRMNFIVASTGNITLKIDPAVVLATRDYVDTRIMEELNKLDSKQSVRVATTANIVLSGLQTVDGVALAAGDRVLVKNQVVAKDNGIWLVAGLAWKRASDADSNAEVTSALLTSVEQGTTQADTRWQLTTDGAIVVGTTSLTFQNVTQGFAPINAPALISPTATSTPAQFDSSKLLATTEFVQRALGSYSGFGAIAASRSATAADAGNLLFVTGVGMTFTLPTPASLGIRNGTAIGVFAASNPMTIAPGAGATLNHVATGNVGSVALLQGQSLTLVAISSLIWQVTLSTCGLGQNADFIYLLGATFSSQQLPGLSIKVGSVSNASTATSIPLTLPTAFPVACVALIFTGSSGMAATYSHQGKDRTGAQVIRGTNANYQFDYVAVGY